MEWLGKEEQSNAVSKAKEKKKPAIKKKIKT